MPVHYICDTRTGKAVDKEYDIRKAEKLLETYRSKARHYSIMSMTHENLDVEETENQF